MQESNFEKQVQQKLGELQLTPSEPVWQNIEVAIRKKKDRRLVFWIVPVLLLAGGLVWWQADTGPLKKAVQQPAASNHTQETFSKPHASQQHQNANTSGQLTNSNKSHVSNATQEITTQEPTQQQNKKVAETAKQTDIAQPPAKKQKQAHDQIATINKNTVAQKLIVATFVKTKPASKSNTAVAATTNETTVPNAVETHSSEPTHTIKETNKAVTATDSAQQQKAAPDSAAKPVPQLQKKTKTAKRLQWSIAGRAGASNTVTSLANSFGQKANATSYPQPDYNNWVSNSRASGYKQPAAPTPGVQYTIGALLKKGVGKKSFIQTGLQYSYYSYHLAVGTEPVENSLINRNRLAAQNTYFNNGKQQQFTNTLQFIELPVGFEYRLSKKLPLHVQHGVTINKLLSGKVLQYDYASNTYIQNSDGLRKTGISLFTVVDYTIWKGKAASLQAGPHLQYGLQSLFKNNEESHLLSGGLALTMGF